MASSRIAWLSDLVRLEIILWNRIDARLREDHDLPLAHFWPLYVIDGSPNENMRVGELAAALGLTVGGTSKVIDRMVSTGLLLREADPKDRRASRIAITADGRRKLEAASKTYELEVAQVLDAALSEDQQDLMHGFVKRLLGASGAGILT